MSEPAAPARGTVTRLALLGALCIALAGTGYIGARRVARQLEVGDLCSSVRAGDWAAALAHGEGLAGADPDGRIAAECICWAYAASDRVDDCAALLERILAAPAARDWVPDAALARMLLRKQLEAGRHDAAARFAGRATAAYPADPALLELELVSRGASEGELAVLDELRARIRGDIDESFDARLVVASGYERQGEFAAALAVLGEQPPSRDPERLPIWFEARAGALGGLQLGDELRALYARWRELGGDPYELRARYAVRLSLHGLVDPEASREDLLFQVLRDEDRIADEKLRRAVYERLIGGLLISHRTAEALEVYDRAAQRFDSLLISREEILRTASAGRISDLRRANEPRVLEFRLPAGAAAGEILLSPPFDQPPDRDYERLAIRPGAAARARRIPGRYPYRWVYRDARGEVLGSGSTWADRAETGIEVRPGAARPVAFEAPAQRAADGRRRVLVVIPDCADWRLLQYLRARGELPMHDFLLARGQRAVLASIPAFTGAAMESLVWPRKQARATFMGWVNQMGLEIAGLASVGRNPFGFLAPVLPESESLFERVGAGDRVALNLLFSHGHVEAGRNAELIGPHGSRRRNASLRAARPLRPEEMRELPDALRERRYLTEVEKLAAELDAAVDVARAREVDLLMLRLEPLDILSHGFFTELMRPRQDDGEATLLWVYRYIDARLREVFEVMDQDDVLVVMSDHGIRTALEHEEDAFFVAVGAGIPHGRVPGQPHLRGVPQLLTSLLGVPSDWPDTGLVAAISAPRHAAR